MAEEETEFVPVPPEEQLDIDDDTDEFANALTEETGADDEDLDDYRNLDGPIWGGPE